MSFRLCLTRNMSLISRALQHSFSDKIEPNGAWALGHFPGNLQVLLQTLELATNRRWQRLHPGVLKPVGQGLSPGTNGIDFHG